MGVFARFRRRSKGDGGTSAAAEAQGGTLTAAPGAEHVEHTEGAADTAEQAKPEGRAGASAAAEAVEIPKQQSVEEAADSGAGESSLK